MSLLFGLCVIFIFYLFRLAKGQSILIYFCMFLAFVLLPFTLFICQMQSNSLNINSPKEQFFPHFTQVPVLSPALTVTRSFAHQATGKHTLLLTSKAHSRRSTSSLEKPTRPKSPRVTYLCLTSPCRNPSSSRTLVRACVHRHIWGMLHLCSQKQLSLESSGKYVSSCECVFFLHKLKCLFIWKFTCRLFTCCSTGLIPSQNPRLAFQQYLEVVGNDRPYKCQFCSKAYKKSSHLKQHVR